MPDREAHNSPQSSPEIHECVALYLHCPRTLSWHDAYWSTGLLFLSHKTAYRVRIIGWRLQVHQWLRTE